MWEPIVLMLQLFHKFGIFQNKNDKMYRLWDQAVWQVFKDHFMVRGKLSFDRGALLL